MTHLSIRNERILFHGTKGLNPMTVALGRQGLDCRMAGDNNLYGRGMYFAEDGKTVWILSTWPDFP